MAPEGVSYSYFNAQQMTMNEANKDQPTKGLRHKSVEVHSEALRPTGLGAYPYNTAAAEHGSVHGERGGEQG